VLEKNPSKEKSGTMKAHNIFISWSGPRSQHIAETLKTWLPTLLQSAKPWMSESDIEKGTRGLDEIGKALAGIKIGITCLTPENLNASWILYEAGALAKALDDKTRLCTYLLGGLKPQDVPPPLGMFQATRPEKADTRKLVSTINVSVNEEPVPDSNLDTLFDKMWPDLEASISSMPAPTAKIPAKRSTEEMVSEILELVRSERQMAALEYGAIARELKNLTTHTPQIGGLWNVEAPGFNRFVALGSVLPGKKCPRCGAIALRSQGEGAELCSSCNTYFLGTGPGEVASKKPRKE
jgi:hypothetical protein